MAPASISRFNRTVDVCRIAAASFRVSETGASRDFLIDKSHFLVNNNRNTFFLLPSVGLVLSQAALLFAAHIGHM
ncbi:hypothetical protein DSECCO2_471910 [anaerobic digester metagenome]